MSESERAERPARGTTAAPVATFAVVASGENVVMVNVFTGQTWAMASDGERPVWQPVGFDGSAPRAPRSFRTAEQPKPGAG